MSRKETRREAREQAFLFIFERSFADDTPVDEVMENALEARGYKASAFASSLFAGVSEHKAEIDALIEEHSHKWKTTRLSRVALSVLRLAVYELLYCEDIPVSVSINEAVELAKSYAGEEDASFINGVLGGIVRACQPKKADKPETSEEEV